MGNDARDKKPLQSDPVLDATAKVESDGSAPVASYSNALPMSPPIEELKGWLCLTINVGESIRVGEDVLVHLPVNNQVSRARIAIRAPGKKIVRHRVYKPGWAKSH